MANGLLQRLQSEIIVLQGPMPTMLQNYGYELDKCYPQWIIEHPDVYQGIHRAYLDAGCDVVEASTGGTNRLRLKRFGLDDRAGEFTRKLLELTREITPKGYPLEGVLALTGHYLAPAGDVTAEEFYEVYEEQVISLCEGGVDYFRVVEEDIKVLEVMIEAIRAHSDLPIMAVMGFQSTPKGYRTLVGGDPATNVRILERDGVVAVGLICGGTSLDDVTKVLEEMRRSCSLPLIAKPNAGIPQLIEGKAVHPVTPEQMAEAAKQWVAAGARAIGGCCGTTPNHIARVAAAVKHA